MKNKTFNSSTKYIILSSLALLVITIAICVLLSIGLRNRVKSMVYQNMSNVSDTASALIDGDAFEMVDENTPKDDQNYQTILNILTIFKDQNDFVYIYTVAITDDGKYIFVIDQDPDDPAKYGDEIVYTDALANCLKEGVTSIDRDASTDKWGSYYSVFAPIKNSSGKIVGAVGIDFDSVWYEKQISSHSIYFFMAFVVSLGGGMLIAFILMSQLLKRFRILSKGLSILSNDIDSLNNEINLKQTSLPIEEEKEVAEAKNEIEEINIKMNSMSTKLKKYIDYVHNQAFTDTMTGVSSKVAYYEYLQSLEEKILNDVADFKVIVFDLNGLKKINDNYGHESGDDFIVDSSKVIMNLFGKEHTFRTGGDEFIVILENDRSDIDEINQIIYDAICDFNNSLPKDRIPVSFSFGTSVYRGNGDTFKQVFKRADEIMYQYKNAYYENLNKQKNNE